MTLVNTKHQESIFKHDVTLQHDIIGNSGPQKVESVLLEYKYIKPIIPLSDLLNPVQFMVVGIIDAYTAFNL